MTRTAQSDAGSPAGPGFAVQIVEAVLVAVMGCFGLVAQTVVFRDFLGAFEGSEFGIAWFFCTWLLWVAVGAVLARLAVSRSRVPRLELMVLLYLPAVLLQRHLVLNARGLAGILPYEVFIFARMLPVTLLANAPVSACTGFFFVAACRWLSERHGIRVVRVYLLEALGSFAGGTGITLLLAAGLSAERVLVAAMLLLAAATAACLLAAKRQRLLVAVLALLAVGMVYARLDRRWTEQRDQAVWARFVPGTHHGGTFVTPGARYVYGMRGRQFNVVARESIVDTIPDAEHASSVIALHLAHRPAARRILVAGGGSFAICRRLLLFEQVERVTWLCPDPEYPGRLLDALPDEFRIRDPRLHTPRAEMRRTIETSSRTFDVVILDLPDVSTLALNRYMTQEFFGCVRDCLAPGGIVGVRVSGAENYMGEETVNIGASVYRSLSEVFRNITVKPGDDSWLIASDQPLESAPAVLRDRFAAIPGAAKVYRPDAVLSLYLPDRMVAQLARYRQAVEAAPPGLLRNTDRSPRALLHGLLLAARTSGGGKVLPRIVRTLAVSGTLLVPCAIGLYLLLRLIYRLRSRGKRADASVPHGDVGALVFVSGWASMGLSLVLMFLYQSIHGTIFLHVGLISALFMLGIFSGGSLAEQLLRRWPDRARAILLSAALLHAGFILVVALLPSDVSQAAFAALFVGGGLLSGMAVPVAARWLKAGGVDDRAAGMVVEVSDHLGGALGGLVSGLALLPLFGPAYALGATEALFLAGVYLALLRLRVAVGQDPVRRFTRPAGYAMTGCAVFLLVVAHTLDRDERGNLRALFEQSARAMAGDRRLQAPGGQADHFALVDKTGRETGYAASSEKRAARVRGYGGSIVLAVVLERDGTLADYRILESNETPVYLRLVGPWLASLKGRKLFEKEPFEGIEGVTGATMTCDAVRETLRQTGHSFGREVLALDLGEETRPGRRGPGKGVVAVIAFGAAAMALRRRPSRAGRILYLVVLAGVCGWWLNAQYSMSHVLGLLGPRGPALELSLVALLAFGVPAAVLLFGNVYCGYLCPFGALQELLGELAWKLPSVDPGKRVWGVGRFVKYVVLFGLVVAYGLTRDRQLVSGDPLVTVFGIAWGRGLGFLIVSVLVLSLFYKRFWCRNLCPSGAFLSLLNGARLLWRRKPVIHPGRCDMGVSNADDFDCLCCDRCRTAQAKTQEGGVTPLRSLVFILAMIVMTWFLARTLSAEWRLVRSEGSSHRGVSATVRNVDMPKLQQSIREGRLSDRDAAFWGPVQEPEGPR